MPFIRPDRTRRVALLLPIGAVALAVGLLTGIDWLSGFGVGLLAGGALVLLINRIVGRGDTP